MIKQNHLVKSARLKSRKQIDALFTGGKRFVGQPFRVHYIINKNGPASLQFGVGVSNKLFPHAVDRNRIKRVTREIYRVQKQVLLDTVNEKKMALSVFFIYIAKELPVYQEMTGPMNKSLSRLQKTINETH